MHWTEWVLVFLAFYAAGDIIASIITAVFAEKAVKEVIQDIQDGEDKQ